MGNRDADRDQWAAVIADIERGSNTKDPVLSVTHFLPEAWTVTVAGSEAEGREALLEAHRRGLSGPLRDQYARYDYARYDVVRVALPAPDVAVLQEHARVTDADGRPLDVGHAMTALYVFVRRDGRWQVLARQNTLVHQ
ncbi:SgcJ/EcaC family oxidoreductase [Geodermatophilus sp. SYSU D01105]